VSDGAPSRGEPGRALGVDLGSRRVGLALTDRRRIISSPHSTIPMTSENALAAELLALCARNEVSLVVIGLPLSADGSEGPGCIRARRVASALERGGLSVRLQDESWSSRDAEEILRQTGKSRRTAKEKVDAIAASLILRDFLQEASQP
jgi:putative holliday junction resolvase